MTNWTWIALDVVLAIHDEQLAEHGGATGLRDRALLESALARPRQLAAYGKPDAAALAAAHMYGFARNHPFVDGNKRTAFVLAELFLALNGFELTASDSACVETTLDVASGAISEADLSAWMRKNSTRR
jgi:death-on-curing protein